MINNKELRIRKKKKEKKKACFCFIKLFEQAPHESCRARTGLIYSINSGSRG